MTAIPARDVRGARDAPADRNGRHAPDDDRARESGGSPVTSAILVVLAILAILAILALTTATVSQRPQTEWIARERDTTLPAPRRPAPRRVVIARRS